MRRELRSVRSGKYLGAVDDTRGPGFEGAAEQVLASLRTRLGDEETIAHVLAEGWSNGYLYFADPVDEPALVAAAQVHTGAMVALVPSEEDAARLAVDGGEPADQLHVTLAYLGEAADIPDDARAGIIERLRGTVEDAVAPDYALPLGADGFALSLFNPTNDERDTCIVLGLSGADLDAVHDMTLSSLAEVAGLTVPDQHAPFSPHLTLIYTEDAGQLAELVDRTGPVTFDRLRVAFGPDVTDIPMEAAMTTPALLSAAADMATGMPGAPPGGDYGLTVAPPGVEHFHTVVMEGVSTGLRTFAEGSLTWRTPPFAFHWEYSSAAHGGQMMVAQVGLVTRVERMGSEIHFWGPLDLADPMALEFARKLAGGFTRWTSIGIDESLKDSDVELVFPEDDAGEDDGGGLMDIFGPEPEQIIFHAARIAEVTAVSVPALADATVEPTQALIDALGGEAVADIPTAEEIAMTAAGYTITIPDLPPAHWFDEPAEEPAIGALTITDEGRVFGWLAPAGVTHRGFRGQRDVFVPKHLDMSEFLNKTQIATAADGTTVRLNTGNVTMSCGHASPIDPRRADPGWASDHYENSCSIFAKIRTGYAVNGGMWVAGAVLPDVDWGQISRAMGCALSLDAQGGKLKAALMVPVEGFPKAQHATVRIVEGALVASAIPVRFRPAGQQPVNLRPILEAMARNLGRDSMSRLAALRARHPGKAPS